MTIGSNRQTICPGEYLFDMKMKSLAASFTSGVCCSRALGTPLMVKWKKRLGACLSTSSILLKRGRKSFDQRTKEWVRSGRRDTSRTFPEYGFLTEADPCSSLFMSQSVKKAGMSVLRLPQVWCFMYANFFLI